MVRLIPTAREINSGMPDHIFNLLKNRMEDFNKKRILILGYSYLSDSDDTRNSPSEELVKLIKNTGANIVIHDPFIKEYSGDVIEKAENCDAVVLMTAHSEYESIDLKRLKRVMQTPFIIDGRNILDRKHVINAGFQLVRLGDTSRGEE